MAKEEEMGKCGEERPMKDENNAYDYSNQKPAPNNSEILEKRRKVKKASQRDHRNLIWRERRGSGSPVT
uniref:BZIP domain-containing protein n=1 Tax=Steinernema glaseri TaxID=37863 RepID=A0A1I8AWD7_9BILA